MDHEDVRARINAGNPINIFSRFRHRIREHVYREIIIGIYEEMKVGPRYRITTEVLSITGTGPYSVHMES